MYQKNCDTSHALTLSQINEFFIQISPPTTEKQHLKSQNFISHKTLFIQSADTGECMLLNPIIPLSDDNVITS